MRVYERRAKCEGQRVARGERQIRNPQSEIRTPV
jgi:hypothetical protein